MLMANSKTDHFDSNDGRQGRSASISAFFAVLFVTLLIAAGLIGYKETRNIRSVQGLTKKIQSGLLPEFVDSQKTLMNIENLRRLTEIAYVSDNQRTRRNARISARALVAESIFTSDVQMQTEAVEVSQAIAELVKIRDDIENLKQQLLVSSQSYFAALTRLSGHVSDDAAISRLFGFFFADMLAGAGAASAADGRHRADRYQAHLAEVREVYEQALSRPEAAAEALRSSYAEIETSLQSYLDKAAEIEILRGKAQACWAGIDMVLKSMRDKIRQGSEHAINNALASIQTAAQATTATTHLMFGFMIVFILVSFAVVYIYITKPLRWTSEKLKEIQAGRLDTPPPPIIVTEIATIASLLDRFSDHLAYLYKQTNQLEEEAARKKDIEEIMRAVFMASLDGYIVWTRDNRLELISQGALNLLGLSGDESDSNDYRRFFKVSQERFQTLFKKPWPAAACVRN